MHALVNFLQATSLPCFRPCRSPHSKAGLTFQERKSLTKLGSHTNSQLKLALAPCSSMDMACEQGPDVTRKKKRSIKTSNNYPAPTVELKCHDWVPLIFTCQQTPWSDKTYKKGRSFPQPHGRLLQARGEGRSKKYKGGRLKKTVGANGSREWVTSFQSQRCQKQTHQRATPFPAPKMLALYKRQKQKQHWEEKTRHGNKCTWDLRGIKCTNITGLCRGN